MLKLSNYLNQIESTLIALKKGKLTLSFEDYNVGDNLFINEDDKMIRVKSLISIIEFEDGSKFDLILDYSVEIIVNEKLENDKKIITIFFNEHDKIIEVPLSKEDIKGQVLYIQRLLGGRELYKDIDHLFLKLYKVYAPISDMDLVHLEVLLSQCLRDKNNPMIPARVGSDPMHPVMINIKTNVFNSSFVQGLCFENVGKAIKTGLLSNGELEPSILEKVLTGSLVIKEEE
jgi:hypothetical protein